MDLKPALAYRPEENSTFFHLFPLYQDEQLRQDESMMHECPKCGFVQPKDRYCANCGLDIENYTPAPPPWHKKFGQNIGLQVGLALSLIALLAASIYWSQKEELEKHFQQAPSSLEEMAKINNNRKGQKASPADETERTALLGGSQEVAEPPGSQRNKTETTTAVASTMTATAPESSETTLANAGIGGNEKSATSDEANRKPQELVVAFAEASKIVLQQLAAEGQILNETAQTRSFTHNAKDVLALLKERDPDFKPLPGGEKHSLRVNSPALFDFTHIGSDHTADLGFNLEITPLSISNTLIEIDLGGSLHLRGAQGQSLANQEINANYAFQPQKTLILVGVLPRQTTSPSDMAQFSNTPLTILDSPQFLSGVTEFVIFFQIK